MAKSKVSGVGETRFFETGYILINEKAFDVEEISINLSRDLNPYHVASQRDPIDQRPGRTKIDFSFKRAFGDKVFLSIFTQNCTFSMTLVNNDADEAQKVVRLTGCRLSQDNIGPVNGGDIVSEDIQGSASGIEFDCDKIKSALGIEAFQGLGRMLGYLNFQNLVKLQPFFTGKLFTESTAALAAINKQFGSPFVCTDLNPNLEDDLLNNMRKFNTKITDEIMDRILKIGQIEYMRKLHNYILTENSVIDCSILNTELKSLDIINLLIMKNDIKINFQGDEANPDNANPENKKGNSNLDIYYNNLLSFLEDFGYIDTEHTFFQDLNSLQY